MWLNADKRRFLMNSITDGKLVEADTPALVICGEFGVGIMGVTPGGVRGVATPHIMGCGGCQCIATPRNLKKFNSQNRIFCEYVLFICTSG